MLLDSTFVVAGWCRNWLRCKSTRSFGTSERKVCFYVMLNIDFLAFPEIKNWRVFWGFKGCEHGEGGNIQWIDKDAKLESLQKHSE